MNRAALVERLRDSKISENRFSIDGTPKNEATIIEQIGSDTWCTYYSERGERTDERYFSTEDEACRSVYEDFVKWEGYKGRS
jgi:hypothetical protein